MLRDYSEDDSGTGAGTPIYTYKYGTSANDRFAATGTAEYFVGGAGWDTVSYWSATSAVEIYLANTSANRGYAAGDVYSGIEVIDGSRFNDILVGNSAANAFWGDAGNDRLAGGAGADTLGGGSGWDTFVFDTALGGSNVDTITDFDASSEAIVLSRSVFSNIYTHELGIWSSNFTKGAAAADALHRLIYNPETGDLFYDSDGAGGAAQVKFAILGKHLALSAENFALAWL